MRTEAERTDAMDSGAMRTDDILAAIEDLGARLEAVEDARLAESEGMSWDADPSDAEAASGAETPSTSSPCHRWR